MIIPKHRRKANPITGYDIRCDECGDTWAYRSGGINTSPYFETPYWNSSTGNINEIAINEIKTEFVLKNQY